MSDETVIMSMSEVGWKIYRVTTASGQYSLGVFTGGGERRPCAVLRGTPHGLKQYVDTQDSAPLVGGTSLFLLPAEDWIGKRLEVGTRTTSAIQSVEREKDRSIVTSITSTASLVAPKATQAVRTQVAAQAAREAPDSKPYPEDYVEHVEFAATLLRAILKRGVAADLKGLTLLRQRFKHGLGECLLNIRSIDEQLGEHDRAR